MTLTDQFLTLVVGNGNEDEFMDALQSEAKHCNVTEEMVLFDLQREVMGIYSDAITDLLDILSMRREG